MEQHARAIYENGTLRLLEKVDIAEGQEIGVTLHELTPREITRAILKDILLEIPDDGDDEDFDEAALLAEIHKATQGVTLSDAVIEEREQGWVTDYYLDTSGIIKRYVLERGSSWIETITADPAHTVHIAQITLVEVITAVNRRVREGSLTPVDAANIQIVFQRHIKRQYNVVNFTYARVYELQQLAFRHPLRAYDAVQLASALEVNPITEPRGTDTYHFCLR